MTQKLTREKAAKQAARWFDQQDPIPPSASDFLEQRWKNEPGIACSDWVVEGYIAYLMGEDP